MQHRRSLTFAFLTLAFITSASVVVRAAAMPPAPLPPPMPELATLRKLPEGVTQQRAPIEVTCAERQQRTTCNVVDRLIVRNTTQETAVLELLKPMFASGTVLVGETRYDVMQLPTHSHWDRPVISTMNDRIIGLSLAPSQTIEIRTAAVFNAEERMQDNDRDVFYADRTQHMFLHPNVRRLYFAFTIAHDADAAVPTENLVVITHVAPRWTRATSPSTEHVSEGVFVTRSERSMDVGCSFETAPVAPVRVTGAMMMLGATTTLPNGKSRFTMGLGADVTFHPWIVGNLMVETDFQQSLRITPTVSVHTPYLFLFPVLVLPSLSAGIGTPIRFFPQAEPGLRVTATAQYPILGAFFAADYYPISNTGELTGGVRLGF